MPFPQDESRRRRLPLVDLLVDTWTELLELVTRSGLQVLTVMLEEDRTALCGPRYADEPHKEMPKLVTALLARDQQLGLLKQEAGKVA